jgi:hypothetical protein
MRTDVETDMNLIVAFRNLASTFKHEGHKHFKIPVNARKIGRSVLRRPSKRWKDQGSGRSLYYVVTAASNNGNHFFYITTFQKPFLL